MNKTKCIIFRAGPDSLTKIKRIKAQTGISASEILRRMIDHVDQNGVEGLATNSESGVNSRQGSHAAFAS